MFEQLHQVVNSQIRFSDSEWAIFEQAFTFRQVPGKFRLVDEGAVAREIYFINEGLIRLFYNKDGDEITGFIFQENLFCASYESFLRQAPGIQILETIEACDLLVLSYEALQQLYIELPKINILTRKIAEQRFIHAQEILSSFILDKPEERYRKFASRYPELLLRTPQHIIASFLGITPVSLSRIRKRVSRK